MKFIKLIGRNNEEIYLRVCDILKFQSHEVNNTKSIIETEKEKWVVRDSPSEIHALINSAGEK